MGSGFGRMEGLGLGGVVSFRFGLWWRHGFGVGLQARSVAYPSAPVPPMRRPLACGRSWHIVFASPEIAMIVFRKPPLNPKA